MEEFGESFRSVAVSQGWSRTVEASRRDVYEALLHLRSGGVGMAVASFDTLAALSGRSRPLVVTAVADLVSAGLIVHHPPLKDPQRQLPSCYEVRVVGTR